MDLANNLPSWVSVGLQGFELMCGLAGAAGGAIIFTVRHSLVTKEDLDRRDAEHRRIHEKIEARLDTGSDQFKGLTQAIAALPARIDHDQIKAAVAGVSNDVGRLQTELHGLRELLTAVERPLNILVEEKLRGHRG